MGSSLSNWLPNLATDSCSKDENVFKNFHSSLQAKCGSAFAMLFRCKIFLSISFQFLFFVFAGLRLNNAWASGTVLRPFLQPESPLSSRSLVFKCKLRDSNSRLPYSRPRALTTRLYNIHSFQVLFLFYFSFYFWDLRMSLLSLKCATWPMWHVVYFRKISKLFFKMYFKTWDLCTFFIYYF